LGFNYACQWSELSLRILGIWPNAHYSTRSKLRAHFYVIFVLLAYYLPQTGTIVIIFGDIDSMINLLSYNVSGLVAIAKYIVIYRHKKVLKSIIQKMSEDWKANNSDFDLKIMIGNARIGRILAFISILYAPLIVTLHILVTMFLKPDKDLLYASVPTVANNLMWPSYFLFDTSRKYVFEATWFCQILATTGASLIYGTFDTFIAVIVLHICSQLAIVRKRLRNLHNGLKSQYSLSHDLFNKKFSDIIKRHEELISMADTIENTFNIVLLPQFICYPLIFCFQGYAMLTSMAKTQASSLKILYYLSYDTYTLYHLFIFCWIGEQLINESKSISSSYYESSWYNYSPTNSRSLMLIGYRAMRPLYISAGKYARFSLNLFVSLLKTSMGYLSMLRAVQVRNL
ncbi:odorant receptor 13a-like, partial [Cotesia typhae]|uniref:odorant receptor 13a-like n=1 Tax=Cotesia typhae TaxID=2053667 RepID=UPI003D6938B0